MKRHIATRTNVLPESYTDRLSLALFYRPFWANSFNMEVEENHLRLEFFSGSEGNITVNGEKEFNLPEIKKEYLYCQICKKVTLHSIGDYYKHCLSK